jgi:putative tricarboxylic transport membrane protein
MSIFVMVLMFAILWISGGEASEWKPSKTVEFMVPNSPGGGTDIFARTLEKVLRENHLVDVPITIINKPGGSGAVNFAYILSKRGDGHTLSAASTAFWTTPLSGTTNYKFSDFTPLANFAMDPLILMVKGDSPINSAQELVEYAKVNPGKFVFGGSSLITEGGLLTFALENAGQCRFKYVPYDGSGDALAALLGGHIQGGWMNVSEASALLKSGNLKSIAIALEKRLDAYPDLLTLKEQGYDVTLAQYRHVVGPPEMPAEAVEFWGEAFEKAYNTSEFKAYLEENGQIGLFTGPEKYAVTCIELGNVYAPLVEKALAEEK